MTSTMSYDVHIISDIWFRILCSHLLKCKGFKNEFIKHFSWGSNRFTISKWSTWIGNYNILYSYIFNWFKLYLERKWILCFIIKWILRVLPFWLHWWEYCSTFCLFNVILISWLGTFIWYYSRQLSKSNISFYVK